MRLSTDETYRAETLRIIGELATGFAHDLNQSLGLIAGYAELSLRQLADGRVEPDELRHHLELVHGAAVAGATLLTRILRFARLGSEEPVAPVDLRELLTDVAELTAVRWRDTAQAEGRPIDVRVEADRDCLVLGSRPSLQHLFTNLIFNAIEALPQGGSIVLRADRLADAVEVEVSDTGRGMPPEVQARMFEPFFTTRGPAGTGLGLAQIWQAVDQHGGSIEVESAPDEGTTFRLRFPLAQPPAAAADEPQAPVAPGGRPLRVLVVDDQPSLARLAATVLARDGHAVDIAHSGGEALAYLAHRAVDAVVSDLGLGMGINGWTLAARVKELWPATSFVLVTGWSAAIDATAARAAGVDAVVAKPYRLAALRQALGTL
jgi:CheY-like chemotaxis protein